MALIKFKKSCLHPHGANPAQPKQNECVIPIHFYPILIKNEPPSFRYGADVAPWHPKVDPLNQCSRICLRCPYALSPAQTSPPLVFASAI